MKYLFLRKNIKNQSKETNTTLDQETDLINRVTSEKKRADHKFQNTYGFDAKKRKGDDQCKQSNVKNADGDKSSNATVNKNQNRGIEEAGKNDNRGLKGGNRQKEFSNKEESYRRQGDTCGDRRWLEDKMEDRRQEDNREDRRTENNRENNWGNRRLEDNREDRRQEDYKLEEREYRVREEYHSQEREDRRREDYREDRRRENEREDRYRGEGVRRRESFSPDTVREMEMRESVRLDYTLVIMIFRANDSGQIKSITLLLVYPSNLFHYERS